MKCFLNIAIRRQLRSGFFNFSFLFLLCALSAFVVNISAQDYRTLKPGIEYAEVTKEISGLKVNMNLLRLDLTKVRLDVHHAMDAAIGTEKTSSIATRHGAFAAINAGFFRLDTSLWAGEDVGILMIDNKLLSESSNNRIALGIFNGKEESDVDFAHLNTVGNLLVNKKPKLDLIKGINRERKETEDFVIFTPEFGLTSLTTPVGLEIVVRKGKVTEIRDSEGSSLIPNDGFVISVTGKLRNELNGLRVGDRVEFRMGTISTDYSVTKAKGLIEDIVAGAPQLIKNSKIDITWQEEKSSKSFVETRHPRTAVAKLKEGKFLMITVDGRTESSGGIGLQDLSEYLLSLGATDAMNLDGGGSTTMFVDGKVVNHPSDKEGERKVSDAILVTPRLKK
jgi:exopolysaccharide biosynthesis protein